MITGRGFCVCLLFLCAWCTACAGEKEPGPGPKEQPLAKDVTPVPTERSDRVTPRVDETPPKPFRDWKLVFPSELVQEVAPPKVGELVERAAKDKARLADLLQGDLRREAYRIQNMRERLSLDPGNSVLRFELGDYYYRHELPHLAELELLTALESNGKIGGAHKILADIYRQAGEHGRAIFHGRRAHRDLPMDSTVLFLWGWSVRDSGDIDAAIPIAEYGIEINPMDARVLALLALLRADDERFEDSRDLAKRAIAVDPDHLRAHLILGKAEIALGDEEAGEAEMVLHRRLLLLNSAKLLHRDPPLADWERAAALAHYHQLVGRFDLAAEEITRSHQLLPNNPAARVIESRIHVAQGDEVEAFVLLEGVVAELPENAQGIRALAELLVTCSDETKRDYKRAHPMALGLMDRGGSKDFDVLYTLGVSEAHLGLEREARIHLKAAMALEPTNENVINVLAQLDSGEI